MPADALKIGLLVIAIVLTLWKIRMLLLARSSAGWKRTRGTVLNAYVDESSSFDEDGIDEGFTHSAHVRYSYKIGTRRFESARLTYRPTRGLVFSDALHLLAGITQGREVDVYYDTRRPERAVLVPGSSTNNVVHLALSLGFVGAMCWYVLR